MKITIIDGQGGRIGKTIIEQLKATHKELELYAIGTNSIATSAMLKAGADYGATGENAVLVNAADADIIIGPIGIVFANALLGEITPAIATAVGSSKAYKILIPVNRCNHFVAGCTETSMSEYIRMAVEKIDSILLKGDAPC
jgi:prephenate dehydrogenase